MRIDSSIQNMLQALQPEAAVENIKTQTQVGILKKTLQTEQENAQAILNMMPKGQNLDIRA